MQVSCRSEQTCRTSCSSTGRMLRHGGAPIWTALTVKTGEITGISFPTAKVGPGPIRTLKASPKFTTQISILAFVPPFRLFSAKFTKSSLFAWTGVARTLSVGLGPTGMKPLSPLGGSTIDREGRSEPNSTVVKVFF